MTATRSHSGAAPAAHKARAGAAHSTSDEDTDISGINAIFMLLLAATLFFFAIALFQWLWNTTMPEVFGLRPIRYWVAFRLVLIASFLTAGPMLHFKGVG